MNNNIPNYRLRYETDITQMTVYENILLALQILQTHKRNMQMRLWKVFLLKIEK
jgi:ABC-type ATPase involved in cell division